MSSQTSPAATPSQNATRPTPVSIRHLREMHAKGEKIAMLTCYDATFARLFSDAGVHSLLVGDSLGMAVQGHDSTLPVSLDEMVYHTRCVARARPHSWLIADLPFGAYHDDMAQAVRSSVALMQAGAQMIKLEGGGWTAPAVRALAERGIPVCAHLGLTPQSVHALGGYRVQGREQSGADRLVREARELYDAGAALMVLEAVPGTVAQAVRDAVPDLVTIGIGAGPDCSGQVLVMHDMLGLTPGRLPRFVRNFGADFPSAQAATRAFVTAVADGSFPQVGMHTY
ncbi:3-methyl-2-oxobutanoate hydroxymethyltransferase [Amphibiibacter pelophylacis]|uniref:3-methyl-2-oxobutanoate hydroxymethyltransferase n=1 Tax=Amphibiibacter pelophylacis TaxID=1799477 RepID=A0ACC6P144_9BURK